MDYPTSPNAAAKVGSLWYFTGKPCKRGHVAKRTVGDRKCVACSALWSAENPDKMRASVTKYRAADPVAARARVVAWEKANPDKVSAKVVRYQAANREKLADRTAEWRAANPDKARASQCVSRAKIRARNKAVPGFHTADEVADLFSRQKGKCAYSRFQPTWCKVKITLRNCERDHIVPLAKKGSNRISNIQLLCQPCNRHKNAADPIVFVQRLGGLL
jgi:5-methylcytosine-specific restriction endonuclease McrA